MLEFILYLLLVLYASILAGCIYYWVRMPETIPPAGYRPSTKLSVIIPVRNEAGNIQKLLGLLEKQSYPKALVEVIVVDDHSEDDTVNLIENFQTRLQLKLVRLASFEGLQQKKAAIRKGIELAEGELLVLTDGDCQVQPEWLVNLEYTYRRTGANFISAPVCLLPGRSLFERMQVVEFASLIGTGGASIAAGKPNMCNGANIAYPKFAYEAVNGFAGNEHIASGDDEFLMHKIHRQLGKVVFLKSAAATVHTPAMQQLSQFFSQRVRWASKWRSYSSSNVQAVALVVFLINFALLVAFPLALTQFLSIKVYVQVFIGKFVIDLIFLTLVLNFFNRTKDILYVFPLQLFYIPYVVYAALAGLAGKYQWKGRKIITH